MEGITSQPHPVFPGAVLGLVSDHGSWTTSVGQARRYADATGRLLPDSEQVAMRVDTVVDLASLTKLFTATVILHLAEDGRLSLDDPVGDFLVEYRAPVRDRVTVRQLLTHTSGLPAEIFIWRDVREAAARPAAVLGCPLEAEPGTRFRYSCTGYITLGLLAQRLTGESLDQLVQRIVCRPLGLPDTSYRPLDRLGRHDIDRVAATECRGADDTRGIVHDENAASLNGVSGNAGLFGTVADLLRFGRFFLDGPASITDGTSPLSAATMAEMLTPQLPASIDNDYQSGLSWRIDDRGFMGDLAGRGRTFGHTGFTGTSLLVDPDRRLVAVLLTNRVHPSRDWSDMNAFRRRVATVLAELPLGSRGVSTGSGATRRPGRDGAGR
ncbi:hypothetical protein GCM10009841_06820 [Microlunatus panaciterrae]|nr:serine hydrolase domain-containing protein [Microlunatus panaciterrae]